MDQRAIVWISPIVSLAAAAGSFCVFYQNNDSSRRQQDNHEIATQVAAKVVSEL